MMNHSVDTINFVHPANRVFVHPQEKKSHRQHSTQMIIICGHEVALFLWHDGAFNFKQQKNGEVTAASVFNKNGEMFQC